ncbi:FliH/SctL family protein [Agromyces sp. NPDC057679]|uniref:FliH/SctL family protein n=1 Tax=Agromyces sp. NPDC057679 TaxID=3346207 RepID=UPI0036706449
MLREAAAALNMAAVAEAATATAAAAVAAAEIARAVVGADLSDRGHAAHAALARALDAAIDYPVKTVHLHPDDLTVIPEDTLPDGVDVVADESLTRGDATVHLPAGYLDATIRTAVGRAVDALTGGAE